MSQNYNHYIGPPHSSQTPHVPADPNLDSLSESFIHPGRLPAIQQNYPQSWPEAQNWQNQRSDGYNYNLSYQSHGVDTGTYFPNPQQQEFVPFEEGEGSFINEDQGSHMVIAQAMQSSKQISPTPGTVPHLQTRLTDHAKAQGQHRPISKPEELERASNATTDVSSHKPDASARNDRAAELRAMLLAKRGSTPGTPSNQASKSGETFKLNSNEVNSLQKQLSESKRAEGTAGKNMSRNMIQASVGTKVINTSPEKAPKSSLENTNADTDIDGLLDEVRASIATSADQIKAEERSGLGSSAVKSLKGNENTLSIKGITTGKKLGSNSEIHQQSSNKSPSSSDTSEGEIRSESGKTPSAAHASELSNRAGKEDTRPLDEKDKHEAIINNGLEKHSARGHEGEFSQIRADPTATQVHSGSSSKPYASSPAVSQPRDQPQGSKYDYRRDRYERPFSNQEPRKEYDPDRRRDLELKDRDADPRRPSGFRVFGHYPERVRTDNQIDSDSRRPQLPKYNSEESARQAAEYKKDLEERRRLDARLVDKVEPVKEQIKKEIDSVGPRTPKARVNEAQQLASNHTAHGNDRDIPVRSTGEEGANNFSGEIVDPHGGEDDDVRDWLEMTGYADLSYRKTALARFRKIKALDLQRAELEREALLDSEGRSFIARPQTALPRESVEPKTIISPKAIRTSVLAMPPPPLPTKDTIMKDTIDDIGIKIKDSANRDSLVTTHILEDETRPRINHEQNKTKSSNLKRFYSDDESDARNGRPAEKLSRIDTNGRSIDSKAEVTPTGKTQRPFDNRITRNEGAHERIRSRSPESRHRSPSPTRGRTFNYEKHEKYEKYMPRQRSRGSPARKSGYSPERQMYGQVSSIEKPRSLEKQPWCWNCERSGHVSRDCKIIRKRNDNEAKQPFYEDSRDSPYFSKRNEVRAENDQESLYLGEYPATTRSFAGNYYQQYHSNNYRGRGRGGRAGYTYTNHRGGYKPYKPNEAVHDLSFSGGSEGINFKAGG